jgi:hypothetical protein
MCKPSNGEDETPRPFSDLVPGMLKLIDMSTDMINPEMRNAIFFDRSRI